MFPASTKGGGQVFAFPDVCKVPAPPAPPIPTPFPNIGMCNQANGGTCSKKVKILNQPVITKASEITQTMGDEAGTLKGVSSGTNMDKATFKVGVSKVKVEGNDIVNLLKTTAQNGASANAPAGNVIAPSQTTVLVNG
ncbi:MAG: DUF4150 domain-containing protein [Myxococcales bacterium]|nr:DUF4150 domain-containing protein [Myxococcales bacterium]